jgi:nucleoside-diphosphate-sugar epimerase
MTMKKIVLTGATGFLGSHLASMLIKNGYQVIALKRRSSSLHRLANISSELEMVDVDDVNFDEVFSKFGKIDAIIHTATCYGRNDESISEIFSANTDFPLKLLDAGIRAGVDMFINTDTILDKYLNLYALSKNQLLQWGRFFSLHKNICFVNLRLEHFYGAYDDPSKFSTYVIKGCLDSTSELKLTKGEQKRDFIHVDDVVSAYLALLKNKQNFSSPFVEFDVGTGRSISIREFVETVHRISGSKTELVFGAIPYREGEVMHSEANISGLVDLGWRCFYDVETGLSEVMQREMNKL